MILAETELQIGPRPGRASWCSTTRARREFAPGTPLREVLAISMDVFELEITPNRPDCLGVYGVARELHAATGAPLRPRPGTRTPAARGRWRRGAPSLECAAPTSARASPRACSRTSPSRPRRRG